MTGSGEAQHHARVSLFTPQSFTETISLIESLPTTQKLYKVDSDHAALMNVPLTTVTLFIKSIGFTETLTRDFVRTVLQTGSCNKIKSLYLLDCEFSSLVTLLKPFQRVQNLSITASRIRSFAELPLLPNVISLHLDGNAISSWTHFPDAPKLAFLSLNYNKLESFAHFPVTKLKTLEIFSAVGNGFETILPSPELDLDQDAITDSVEDTMPSCDDAFCTALSVISLFLRGGRINSINSMNTVDLVARYLKLLAIKQSGTTQIPEQLSVNLKPTSGDTLLSSHKLLEQRISTEDLFLANVDNTLPYRTLHSLSNWISDEGVEYLRRPDITLSSLQFKVYCSRFLHRKSIVTPILKAGFFLLEQRADAGSDEVYIENDECCFRVNLLSPKYKLIEVLFYHTSFGCAPQLLHSVTQKVHAGSSHDEAHNNEKASRLGSYAATNGGYQVVPASDEPSSAGFDFTFVLPASFLSNTHVIALIKVEERASHAQRMAGNALRRVGTQLERDSHQSALLSIFKDNLSTRTMMTNIRSVQIEMHVASPPIVSCKPTIRSANFLLSAKELQVGNLINLRYSYSGGEEGATVVTWYRCASICGACQDSYTSMTTSLSYLSDLTGEQYSISQPAADCSCVLEQLKQGKVTEMSSICEYTPTLSDANMFLRAEIQPVSCHGVVGERFILLSTRVIVDEAQIIKTCTLEKVDTSHALLNIISLVPVDLEIYWYQEAPTGEKNYISEYDNDRVFDLKSSIIEQYRLYGSVVIICETFFYLVPLTDAERYSCDQGTNTTVPLLTKTLRAEFYVNSMRRNTVSRTPRTRSVSSKHDSKPGASHFSATPLRSSSRDCRGSDDGHNRVAHTSEFASQKVPCRGGYLELGKPSPLWQVTTCTHESCVNMGESYGENAEMRGTGGADRCHTASVTALNPIKKSTRFSDDREAPQDPTQLSQPAQSAVHMAYSGHQEVSQPTNVLSIFQSKTSHGSKPLINAYNDSRTDTNSWDLSEDGDINKNILASRQRLSRMDQSKASEVPKSLVLQESNYTDSFTILQDSVEQEPPKHADSRPGGIQFEFPSSCVEMCSTEMDDSNRGQPVLHGTSYRDLAGDAVDDHILTSKGILSPIVVLTSTAVRQDRLGKHSGVDNHHMASSTVELMETNHSSAKNIYIQWPDRRSSNKHANITNNDEHSEPSRISERMSTSESIPELAITPQPLDLGNCAREIEVSVNLMTSGEEKEEKEEKNSSTAESSCIETIIAPPAQSNANISVASTSLPFNPSMDLKKGYVEEQLESSLINTEPALKQMESGLVIPSSTPSYGGSSASERLKLTRAFENEVGFKNNVINVRITREAHVVGDILGFEIYGAVDQNMSVFIVRSYADGIYFESGLTQLAPAKLSSYCQAFVYRVTPFDLGSSLRVIVRALGSFEETNLVDRLLDASVISAADTDVSLLMWKRVCADRTYKLECECREDASAKQGSGVLFYNEKLFTFKHNKKLIYTCKDMRRLPYEVEFVPCLNVKTLSFKVKGTKNLSYSFIFTRIEDLGFVYYRLLHTSGLSLLYY